MKYLHYPPQREKHTFRYRFITSANVGNETSIKIIAQRS